MFSTVKTHISALADQIKSQEMSLTSSMVVLSTSLLNYFLSSSFFKCPKSSHEIYGWSFLVCPGLLLFLLTLLGSSRLSRAVSGFCLSDKDVSKRALLGKRKRTWKFVIRSISMALCMATLAFLSWVVVTLLTTDTYACIKLGPPNKTAKYKDAKEKCETHSKATGLILLTVCLLISLVANFAVKCCFSDIPEKDLPSMRRYDKIEALAASKELASLIEKSANARGKEMVERFLLHNCQPKIETKNTKLKQETTEIVKPALKDQGKDDEENSSDVISRDDIDKLRRFLALRYPRLDGNELYGYCRQTELPENFHYDEVDNIPAYNDMHKKTESAVAFVADKNVDLALFSKSGVRSWEPNVHSLPMTL